MEQRPSKRQRLHLFRLFSAITIILLCSGLAWAATVRTAGNGLSQATASQPKRAPQTWIAPTVPTPPSYDEGEAWTYGQTYYIRNAGAGLFLTGANSWATQISLSADATPYMKFVIESCDDSSYPNCVKIKANGIFTTYGGNGYENGRNVGNSYLFRDSETSGFIDRGTQLCWYWLITSAGDDTYYIQSAPGMNNWNSSGNEYMVGNGAGNACLLNGTSSNTLAKWQFVSTNFDGYEDKLAIYEARLKLYNLYLEAVEDGFDVTAASTVYNNADATVEDLENAYSDLQAVMEGGNYDFSGASLDAPLDVTDQVITNPTFDSNVDGWTCAGDANFWIQIRTDGVVDASKNYVQIRNFAESWLASPNTLPEGAFYQTAYGLPAGLYRLEVDAMAVYQDSTDPDPENAVTGVYLFVAGPDGDIVEPLPFKAPNGQPKHWTLTFISRGETAISYGIRTVSCTANWISCDNFQLFYLGNTDKTPEQIALEQVISSAEEFNLDNIRAQATVKSAFSDALATAKAVCTSTNATTLNAAKVALQQAIDDLQASINAYKTVNAFIMELQAKIECSDDNQWTSLSTTLNSLQTEVETGYEQGALTSEDIAGLDARLQQILANFIASTTVQAGDDLTLLIQNAEFSIGSGSNLTGTAIPGWNIISGSITELSANYHNIEAYHRTFNMQQTLTYNLPAGTYRITVQGFVRIDSGNNSMMLYAGASERQFKLLTDESSDVQILNNGSGSTAWPYDLRNTVLGGYMPNSMQGANMYFETINTTTQQPYYLNDVTISHLGGELTIGVKCDDTGLWILWDNFTLTYVNDNALAPFFDDIDALAAQLKSLADGYQTLPDELNEAYTAVMARVENKQSITSVDDAIALCNDIKALIQQLSLKEPYARITEEYGVKTLTFYYGEATDDALKVADYYTSYSGRAWHSEASSIGKVVFDPSFADYRPTSTRYWFYNMQNLTAIESIENLNTSNVTDMGYMFVWCFELTSLDVSNFDTSNVTDMSDMFDYCRSLTSLDLSNFDTSNVTNMDEMFKGCSGLTSLNVSNFDTSNVKSMGDMFYNCSGLTNLDVSNFDTSNVTDMRNMFSSCSGLTSLDLSNFDTSNVTNMREMFKGCSGLTSLDLSNFDTSKVTNMSEMFQGCSGLTSLDLSNFDTSNVTDMYYMFVDCSGLTSLDVRNFNTSKVIYMEGMFGKCRSLTSLDVSHFDTSNVTDMSGMFYGCSGLTSLNVSNFDTSNVKRMGCCYGNPNLEGMFGYCTSLTSLDLSNFDTSNVTWMNDMFKGCSGLTSLDLSNFNTCNVTFMDEMFAGCSGLTSLDLSNFDTRNVTYMYSMFNGCSSLTSLDVSNLDTRNVTDMYYMFQGCSGLTSLDLSNFDTSNVTSMFDMFHDCSGLTSLDVSNFDTRNVNRMDLMFSVCSGLTSLDLSNFDTSKVTTMAWMFSSCSSLTTIYVGESWSINSVQSGANMFSGCTNLIGGQGTSYSEDHTDHTYAHIDGGADNPGYFTAASSVVLAGDANCDGVVNAADVTLLADFIVGKTILTAVQKANADMNGDGIITISDLTSLLKICQQQ